VEQLTTAIEMMREMGMTHWLDVAERELGDVGEKDTYERRCQ